MLEDLGPAFGGLVRSVTHRGGGRDCEDGSDSIVGV